jgi:hypothetical protein
VVGRRGPYPLFTSVKIITLLKMFYTTVTGVWPRQSNKFPIQRRTLRLAAGFFIPHLGKLPLAKKSTYPRRRSRNRDAAGVCCSHKVLDSGFIPDNRPKGAGYETLATNRTTSAPSTVVPRAVWAANHCSYSISFYEVNPGFAA